MSEKLKALAAMFSGEGYISGPVTAITIKIERDNGDTTIMITDEDCEDLPTVLTMLGITLRRADFPYVKTLTANCTNGWDHTGA